MPNRRTFIKALTALPPALSLSPIWAAGPDGAKQALVIGNGAYDGMELPNPPNDARAIAGLLGDAGFTINLNINATRADMLAAMDGFAKTIRPSGTKTAVFYYAGHGVQLDWRNYLVPVDAIVDKRSDIQTRCADLNALLSQLAEIKDKTFVVILDACRDDPFGKKYKPEARGLSQFDAPVGSLLGYATAPGKVASDGGGKNGLYTENLVRELATRSVRLEDALKRVRLNVRLASGGEQIPWETTSLESDVFLFGGSGNKLSDAEVERAVEQEIEDWTRVKSSTKVDDWVAYLRKYPNGRFAEVAQHRLDRLMPPPAPIAVASAAPAPAPAAPAKLTLESSAKPSQPSPALAAQPVPKVEPKIELVPANAQPVALGSSLPQDLAPPHVQTPAPAPQPVSDKSTSSKTSAASPVGPASPGQAIRLGPGLPVPQLWTVSKNPYSSGRYHNGRIFTVGDSARVRVVDRHTNLEIREANRVVTQVDLDADLVVYNDGLRSSDTLGNFIANQEKIFRAPHIDTPIEFQLGKKWKSANEVTRNGRTSLVVYEFHIAAVEQVTVPAGTFDAFRVDALGWVIHEQVRWVNTIWQVPGLNTAVRRELSQRNERGQLRVNERQELVELFQQRTGRTS